ncbi:DUF2795 domain-containing protein [Lentzea sp. DG1S-22]|uniref:DUF2795 domain-containing protein n=1 Tax=unclassified Lentzea TaxID=2643253 RepID=UPI001F2E5F52|nr:MULTISPECIES: DUF2795 domain-containing protein [unclassified Lentzea]MCG8922990.1 DUF2795 domain-containing protein [Lentzea sp. CC55]WVH83242.1 DUF2795 domain-containing protein [Lentzea sp. DG1S-22]
MSDTTTIDRLRTVLGDVTYPADKGQLVDHASRNNADEDTVHALHSVPDRVYGSFDEVLDVVAVDQSREA